MSDARKRILRRLTRGGGMIGSPPVLARQSQPIPDWSKEERIRRFTECMHAARAEVYLTLQNNWTELLRSLCRQQKLQALMLDIDGAWGQAVANHAAADGDWPVLSGFPQTSGHWRVLLRANAAAALTTATAGIAATGTLVLCATPAQPRLATQLPRIQIVLLAASKLHTNLIEVTRQFNWGEQNMPDAVQLLSGPAMASSYPLGNPQATTSEEVHIGPETVIVLVIDDA